MEKANCKIEKKKFPTSTQSFFPLSSKDLNTLQSFVQKIRLRDSSELVAELKPLQTRCNIFCLEFLEIIKDH